MKLNSTVKFDSYLFANGRRRLVLDCWMEEYVGIQDDTVKLPVDIQ